MELSRRTFLSRGLAAAGGGIGIALGLAACPSPGTPVHPSFTIDTPLPRLLAEMKKSHEPYVNERAGFFLVAYDTTTTQAKRYVDQRVAARGVMALSNRCTHDRCRVKFCTASQWFECPCQGGKWNRAGEYKLGPAPRGLDRYRISVKGETVTVHTAEVIKGPPRTVNTTGQEKEGPFCM